MQKRMIGWATGGAIVLALTFWLAMGGGQPPLAHGEGPTATPTQTQGTNSDPGGSGGGH